VDTLLAVAIGGFLAVAIVAVRLGRHGAGLGGPAERAAAERRRAAAALEAEDLAQLLDATNAHRRARGLSDRTLEDVLREHD